MSVRKLTRSFSGGEITPELYGHVDQAKFQTGLKTCRNLQVLPHGPVTCRPGLEYVLQTKSSGTVRIIPYSFNTEQSYVIELGDQYARFHANGATVLEAAQTVTSITAANPAVLTYVGADPANGDWMYIAGSTNMPEVNGRFWIVSNVNAGANTFELKDLFGDDFDASALVASTDGTIQRVHEVATPYAAADLFDIDYESNADILTLTHPSYAVRELQRTGAATFTLSTPTFVPAISEPQTISAVVGVGTGSVTYKYTVTAVSEDNFEESVAGTPSSCVNFLGTAGNYNTITWTAPATGTPIRYNIYRADISTGENVYGYIGQAEAATLTFKDGNIIPDTSSTPPIQEDPFSGADNYPGAVGYYEQRKVFGNTNNNPQGYWLTRSGTERSMLRSLPIRDNDSIFNRLVARQVNEIRYFVPLTSLLALTAGAVWAIRSTDGGALTHQTLSTKPQANVGCAKVKPAVTPDSILFADISRTRLHAVDYQWESQTYRAEDVTILAPHLLDDYAIVDMAWEGTPTNTLWAIRDDGTMLGFTYMPIHEVLAWHRHDTDGKFKSAAVIPENNRAALYVVVQREVNGHTLNYIERKHDRRFSELEDWFGVDAGSTYTGAAATTITGLWHLEGKDVEVLGDGSVFPVQTVVNGEITLDTAVSKAHIGLAYPAEAELLPLSLEMEAAGYGRTKSPTQAYVRLYKSSGIKVGTSSADARAYKQRTTEPYGSPPAMISEEIDMLLQAGWDREGSAYIGRDGPLPMTMVSLTLEVEVGD